MNIHLTEVFLGIFIGAVTFTGSVVAFGKLRGKISSKPLMLPNRHKMNWRRWLFLSCCWWCLFVPKAWVCRFWRCW